MSIQDIAAKGRYGDNHLLHVSDAELQGLNALANKTFGHGLTKNPETGLPEAFLFAPFLAPLFSGAVAGALNLGAGSALATGLTAGALGTAEAAARGMDDPLQQGLMAGLTAGAGQAVGNTLGNMGAEGASAAIDAPTKEMIAADAANLSASGMDMAQAGDVLQQSYGDIPGFSSQSFMEPIAAPVTDMSTIAGAPANPATYGQTITEPGFKAVTPQATFSDKLAGAKQAFGTKEGFDAFMGEAQTPLAVGTVGLGGQSALETQQEQRESFEAQEAEKRKKYDDMVARIQANYAEMGRQAPEYTSFGTPVFGGPSAFKEGRSVKSDEQQAYENQIMEKYRAQTAEEPWYTRVPVQVLDRIGIQDPYRMRRAMEVDERAAGGYLEGGIASLKGDGMSDSVPAQIDGSQPAALSTGEYVIPADVVSHLGNGSSDDGAVRLDEMLDRVRMARTGTDEQAPQIKADKYLPA